jgi:hypothetical protein
LRRRDRDPFGCLWSASHASGNEILTVLRYEISIVGLHQLLKGVRGREAWTLPIVSRFGVPHVVGIEFAFRGLTTVVGACNVTGIVFGSG